MTSSWIGNRDNRNRANTSYCPLLDADRWRLNLGLIADLCSSRRIVASRLAINAGPSRSSHSQSVRTCQPWPVSVAHARSSRSRFRLIFARQYSVLCRGIAILQRSQPCQKQPCTNTAMRRPGNAISGRPATFQCSRYPLAPAARSQRRTVSSGRVPAFRLPRIAALTVALLGSG